MLSALLYVGLVTCVQVIAMASLLARVLTFGRVQYGLAELCRFVATITGLRLFSKRGELYTKGPVYYFFNHRSWCDFYLDPITVTGCKHISSLSRMFVYWGIPFPSLIMNLGHNLIFFRRGSSSQDEMNAQLDAHFEQHPSSGMIVYPEGTRNPSGEPIELKTGMMRVAHRMQIPVQIIMTSNKERVMREKPFYAAELGVRCETVFGDVIDPKNFADAGAFIAEVKLAWKRTEAELMAPLADGARARELPVWQPALTGKAVLSALMGILLMVVFLLFPAHVFIGGSAIAALYFLKIYRDSFARGRSSAHATAAATTKLGRTPSNT